MSGPLDIEDFPSLLAYLRETNRIKADERPVLKNLAGGVSNRTVLLRRESGEAWVLKQALAKLRVKVDWFSDPRRVHREALGLRRLGELAPAGSVPSLVFEDQQHHLLAMTAVAQPHENWKSMLLAGRLEHDHVRQFARLLGTVHRRAYQQRDELARQFDDTSFFESLRVEPYYIYTGTQVLAAAAFVRDLVTDTRRRRITLVHGDYSPKNILIHGGRLVLLDHEVIHWGDPAFDLGFSMTHLLSKAHHLPAHRSRFAHAVGIYWQMYLRTIGDVPWAEDLEAMTVRHTLACLLARVAGRSTLEYMDATERSRQQSVITAMLPHPPVFVHELIKIFLQRLQDG